MSVESVQVATHVARLSLEASGRIPLERSLVHVLSMYPIRSTVPVQYLANEVDGDIYVHLTDPAHPGDRSALDVATEIITWLYSYADLYNHIT